MRRMRAYIRLVLFLILTALTYLVRQAGRPLAWIAPRWGIRWRQLVFHGWGKAMAFVIGMRVTVEGRPPRPPFLLVSNHLSYVDIAVLGGRVDGVFVAKSDVRNWPFLGPIVAAFDTVFIDRSRKMDVVQANRGIETALARGEGVVLFAEGTSSPGDRILPLKSSLLFYPAEHNFALSYACLSYRTADKEPPARTHVCWWGDREFMDHFLSMLSLPRFEARLCFGETTVAGGDRKQLAVRVHLAMTAMFTPVAH
jgi:1-acyl-sn-glycerol-3-phosphate acyltransferase